MTPEQNERWQKATNPLGLGFSVDQWQAEYALAALLPAVERSERILAIIGRERLRDFGVPVWAFHFREICITQGREAGGAWWPGFALRAEAALIGLQILYPGRAAARLAYKRVYIRFIREALKPFVEWVIEQKGIRLIGYESVFSLYDLCESVDTCKDYHRRAKIIRTAKARMEHWSKCKFFELDLLRECYRATALVLRMTETYNERPLGFVPFGARGRSGRKPAFPDPTCPPLIDALNRQHQWRLKGARSIDFGESADYTELIAHAYLTALEAECPAPGWLRLE